MVRVLYDGWDLVYQPNSPAAIHLLELLASQPQGVQAAIGLPGISFHPLPMEMETGETVISSVIAAPNSPSGRLRWEQQTIPNLAHTLRAGLIHSFESVALFGKCATALSPTGVDKRPITLGKRTEYPGLAERLRNAMGQGGQTGLAGLFWPADLDQLDSGQANRNRSLALPVPIHPAFKPEAGSNAQGNLSQLDLPATFVLYHGSLDQRRLSDLMLAWSWAAAAIGDNYPLVLAGMSPADQARLDQLTAEYGLERTVRSIPPLSIEELAQLYQASSVVFEPGGTAAWGNSLRLALASARPVVGLENPLSDLILGPAGYLVPLEKKPGERFRAMGAALITVVVEESLAESFVEKARQRSLGFDMQGFSSALADAYQCLAAA